MKKNIILCALLVYALIATVSCTKSSCDNDCLSYENIRLKAMNEIILNYADSTADTGEFDEFVQSESGKQYFEINDELP